MPNTLRNAPKSNVPIERILLESKKRCTALAEAQARKERETYGTQDFVYGAYMGGMRSYFSDMPGREKQSFHEVASAQMIKDDRAIREARGEHPAVSDWFGPGFIGLDLEYQRILSADLIDHTSGPIHTHFSAHSMIDIDYQLKVLGSVAAAKRGEGLTLHTAFLRPFAGLKPYQFEPYMYQSILHLISGTYDAMDDGQLLVELTYMDEAFLANWMEHLQALGIDIVKKDGAPVYRIIKSREKDPPSPYTMPDLNALRDSDPAFADAFETLSRRLLEDVTKQPDDE